MFSGLLIFLGTNELHGISRVINYSGIVRGATQRLVKLEVCNRPNDTLIQYLDDVLYDLQYDDKQQYQLRTLLNKEFNYELSVLDEKWRELKNELNRMRKSDDFRVEKILRISEAHFAIADNAVHLAEDYGENLARMLKLFQIGLILLVGLFLVLQLMRIRKKAQMFERASNTDFATGLPNRNRCGRLFLDYVELDTKINFGMIMFDLNNLKIINDTLGHNVGDKLILEFSKLLRKSVSKDHFVGRFGGDEFIAFLQDTNVEQINNCIAQVKEAVYQYHEVNQKSRFTISFAVGYALSNYTKDLTIQDLFVEADKNMYQHKRKIKA